MSPANEIATLANMTANELQAAAVELCSRGLLTCTRGQPGDDGATYALAWLPLDDPDQYPPEVRQRHAENMRRIAAVPADLG